MDHSTGLHDKTIGLKWYSALGQQQSKILGWHLYSISGTLTQLIFQLLNLEVAFAVLQHSESFHYWLSLFEAYVRFFKVTVCTLQNRWFIANLITNLVLILSQSKVGRWSSFQNQRDWCERLLEMLGDSRLNQERKARSALLASKSTIKTRGIQIAVIAVAPKGKASFVYSYVQRRLRGQYNGKWPNSLVDVLKPLINAIRAINLVRSVSWC